MHVNSSANAPDRDIFACGIITKAAQAFLVLLGSLFCLPFLSVAGELQQHVVVGEITILLGSASEVATSDSHIFAPVGQHIRLMPGTHIKPGDHLTISILSKKHHEALLASHRENNRRSTIASVIQLNQDVSAESSKSFYLKQGGAYNTARHKLSPQYLSAKAHLLSRTNVPGNKLLMVSERRYLHSGFKPQYAPDLAYEHQLLKSWGKRPENIRVMLS